MSAPTPAQVDEVEQDFMRVQDAICDFLSNAGQQEFEEDKWDYHKGKGGGRTRVLEATRRHYNKDGSWSLQTIQNPLPVWEKGAVNFSGIHGESMPESATKALKIPENQPYRATGVSLIIHPSNPWIPTIHMNIRFFICGDRWWFGGGVDLTPYYPILAQVREFHQTLKDLCVRHKVDYDKLKARCDEYFYLPHREETRGIGGLFYDSHNHDFEAVKAFTLELGYTFIKLYSKFVDNGRMTFTQAQREFQLYRRGRYVEFNLIYDRGTKFGLMSNGRIESILVSLPATVHYVYGYTPPADSREAYLYKHFLQPQPWLEMDKPALDALRASYSYLTVKAPGMQVAPVSEADTQRQDISELGSFGSTTKATAAVAAAVAVAGFMKYLRA
eukprot:TRINITY_DN4343_c0_g1_i1.p1 TRINITY_DN4343_c0_g1~~TRINITY_DN4343_c0_g1_i1.p1  ORF type:complete len:387 (+),score=85.87 TRINITY_DN4343_c0_g1_i1:138-1298(+)